MTSSGRCTSTSRRPRKFPHAAHFVVRCSRDAREGPASRNDPSSRSCVTLAAARGVAPARSSPTARWRRFCTSLDTRCTARYRRRNTNTRRDAVRGGSRGGALAPLRVLRVGPGRAPHLIPRTNHGRTHALGDDRRASPRKRNVRRDGSSTTNRVRARRFRRALHRRLGRRTATRLGRVRRRRAKRRVSTGTGRVVGNFDSDISWGNASTYAVRVREVPSGGGVATMVRGGTRSRRAPGRRRGTDYSSTEAPSRRTHSSETCWGRMDSGKITRAGESRSNPKRRARGAGRAVIGPEREGPENPSVDRRASGTEHGR